MKIKIDICLEMSSLEKYIVQGRFMLLGIVLEEAPGLEWVK